MHSIYEYIIIVPSASLSKVSRWKMKIIVIVIIINGKVIVIVI